MKKINTTKPSAFSRKEFGSQGYALTMWLQEVNLKIDAPNRITKLMIAEHLGLWSQQVCPWFAGTARVPFRYVMKLTNFLYLHGALSSTHTNLIEHMAIDNSYILKRK